MMTRDQMKNLKTLVKEAKPYDPSTYGRESFIKLINENPELEKQFEEKINEKFLQRIEEVGECYFIINNRSYKLRKKDNSKTLRIGLCGQERAPLISVDM